MSLTSDQIEIVTLEDGDVTVSVLTLGCITQDWQVPVGGQRKPMVLGYKSAEDYMASPFHMGVIAGPVANRISNASFSLGDDAYQVAPNEGPNLLHGGAKGLGKRIWRVERDGAKSAQFWLDSAHLDDGFPGNRRFEVTVTLDDHKLCYDMVCVTDRPTIVNMAQHNYYGLDQGAPVWTQRLRIPASRYTPVDDALLPTGEIAEVAGAVPDFRTGPLLKDADFDRIGVDLNYVIDAADGLVSELWSENGTVLRLWSDQPGLQVYTSAGLEALGQALDGQVHGRFAGICLEPQKYPDAPNQPGFSDVVITPDQPYRQTTVVEIRGAG